MRSLFGSALTQHSTATTLPSLMRKRVVCNRKYRALIHGTKRSASYPTIEQLAHRILPNVDRVPPALKYPSVRTQLPLKSTFST